MLTPAMRQYHYFKSQYPEAILFFRMGDFYETFYEDAKICAQVLGIALTSRNKNENPIPLAGIPYHALDNYLSKMIKAGHKVAICEQVEDPAQAKGVVKRDVVRLVTPGTLTEDSLLEENVGNYLAAFCFERSLKRKMPDKRAASERVGMAWVELSTGQFYAQTTEARFLLDELVRLGPAECIFPEEDQPGEALPEHFLKQLKEILPAVLTGQPGWTFDPHQSQTVLKEHFGTINLEGFGFDERGDISDDCAIAAAAAIIGYLQNTQKTTLAHITSLGRENRECYLQIDKSTLRSLEIERTIRDGNAAGSLLHCIDQTRTAMGARKLRTWVCYPLNQLKLIQDRQDAVAELVQLDAVRNDIRDFLANMADMERITTRISTARATPRDLLGLCETLKKLPEVKTRLEICSTPLLGQMTRQCDVLDPVAELIEVAIHPDAGFSCRDGNVIRQGYNEEIDRLRSLGQDGKTWLAQYQKRLIEETGMNSLKVGYNKVFGYYIELSKAFKGQEPPGFVRKQTLKNAERYITDELKQYEHEALTAEQRCKELEENLFGDIRDQIAGQTLHLQNTADAVATIDVLASMAHLARHRNYCRPRLQEDADLTIVEGRHPVLDAALGNQFVPNDTLLDKAVGHIAIITGPNMSGKSTYIRQTALLVLLAQTGSYIPAKEARIGLVDRIFTRVGASDELTRGQSTFMVEMMETANILNNATSRSLVILDEVGRGTSTYDGLSLAWAITEHIATKIKCRTLFATHYHEITELADLLDNVKNLNVAVREWKNEVVFLHKIIEGRTDKSYGIHVARLAGIPQAVLRRSQEILNELETNFSREAHLPELGGRLGKPDDRQLLLFDTSAPPDPLLAKLKNIDLNHLTPMEAINLLHKIKQELEERS